MSEQTEQPNVSEPSTRSEIIKFGILAVILLGVPLVIMLLNPIIFGQIVPAVMGEGIVIEETAPITPEVEESETDPVEETPIEETPVEEDASSDSEVDDTIDPEVEVGTEEEGETTVGEVEEGETAVEQPDLVIHTVKQGETLNSIARDYGVTTQAIIQANNIANPNRINLGTDLIIPPAE